MGRPVYIQHLGAIKIKQLAEITTEDRMIRFHVQVGRQCGCFALPAALHGLHLQVLGMACW
jgi:hypothetical protein